MRLKLLQAAGAAKVSSRINPEVALGKYRRDLPSIPCDEGYIINLLSNILNDPP